METYLTVRQVAVRLGRPEQSTLMKHLLSQTDIKPIRVSTYTAIHESDLPKMEAALKAHENRPRIHPQKLKAKAKAAR